MASELTLVHLQEAQGRKQEFLLRFPPQKNLKTQSPSLILYFLTIFTPFIYHHFFSFLPLLISVNYNNLEPISKWASTTKFNSNSRKNSQPNLQSKSFAAFWTQSTMIKARLKLSTKLTCRKLRSQHCFLPALWCKTWDKAAIHTLSSLVNRFLKVAWFTFPSTDTMRRTWINHCLKTQNISMSFKIENL